jgi:hypothetical protein
MVKASTFLAALILAASLATRSDTFPFKAALSGLRHPGDPATRKTAALAPSFNLRSGRSRYGLTRGSAGLSGLSSIETSFRCPLFLSELTRQLAVQNST